MTDEIPDKLNYKNKHLCIAKADSGASNHYWRVQDQHRLHDMKKCAGPSVQLPNGEMIHATANAQLPLSSELSKFAKQTLILPKLASSNLISIGQLCDDNCEIILNKHELTAIKNNKVIVKGYRNKHDGL